MVQSPAISLGNAAVEICFLEKRDTVGGGKTVNLEGHHNAPEEQLVRVTLFRLPFRSQFLKCFIETILIRSPFLKCFIETIPLPFHPS